MKDFVLMGKPSTAAQVQNDHSVTALERIASLKPISKEIQPLPRYETPPSDK